MKKLILLFLLTSSGVFGQTHQKEIISFCDANMGKKVGHGVCYELIQGAFKQYLPSYDMGSIKRDKDRYGKKVKESEVQPGDIITFQGANIDHLAIVYKIVEGKIYMAEQNTTGNLKKSVVEVNLLDYDDLEKNNGKMKISFFRPE